MDYRLYGWSQSRSEDAWGITWGIVFKNWVKQACHVDDATAEGIHDHRSRGQEPGSPASLCFLEEPIKGPSRLIHLLYRQGVPDDLILSAGPAIGPAIPVVRGKVLEVQST